MSGDETWRKLREIRTFAQLCAYLAGELGWPLDEAQLVNEDLEDITFDWEADELGIPADQVKRIARIRQLRPLTASQPWGIFFVDLTGERLLVTPLRRLLQALVTKKRGAHGPSRPTWERDDLLFVVTTQASDGVEMHLLAFFDSETSTPEIRSLPWQPARAPDRYLRRVATELLPRLAWPDTEAKADPEAWRASWRDAFKLRPGEVIRSADRLADRMAATAVDLRAQIGVALDEEDGEGPFSDLLEDVRTQLVAGVDGDRFADMCAQTLVYGVLSARVTDPDGFGVSPVLTAVPLANPFLTAFFEQVHDEALALDLEGSGLEQLVADLRTSNVEAILDQFGSTAKGGDPVIHFYEEFLKRYDSKLRADAGAFYTPQPVVAFMVRTVDQILRERFGLGLGVADPSTWAEVCAHLGIEVPAGIDPEKPFVSMIDPATGTGTFLVEWLRQARRSFTAARPKGNWPEHLRAHVLLAMHAFELMLGPFAIAHLKVALALDDDGLDLVEPNIRLTDTLEHPSNESQFATMLDPVAAEGERASELKTDERFTVVIGNPPYDREQRAAGQMGKRKGGVVRYGVPGVSPLLDAVTEPMKVAGLGVHTKNLYNDYVYFWRWATWQATQLPEGPGVVAFITAASYLDGISMSGLREHLRDVFDELWIVDLGGEGRGALVEENVFDIRTPVAICFGIRAGRRATDGCDARYLRIVGTRQAKFDALSTLRFDPSEAEAIDGAPMGRLTPQLNDGYSSWPTVTDLLPWRHSGSETKRNWVISASQRVLKHRWSELVSAIPRERGTLLKETRDRQASSTPAPLLGGQGHLTALSRLDRDAEPEGYRRYAFRSFDRQWVIADHRVADYPRPVLWRNQSDRQLFLLSLTSSKLGSGPSLMSAAYVPDRNVFNNRGTAVLALYRDSASKVPNVTDGLLDALSDALGGGISAEDLVAYLYGLCGTAAFSEHFADELAEGAGAVHVPITSDVRLFNRVVELGRDLLWWHTWGERFAPAGSKALPPGPAVETGPIRGYPETCSYDAETETLTVGTGTFGPVPEAVWNFDVSGLKPLQSWLGYRMAKRKGKKSSPLDDIRPSRWTFTDELLQLIAILDHTVQVTPTAAALVDEILAGDLIDAADLPAPTAADRKAPKP
ncbi:MAG: N-6 DNA methylase [Actinobacteria bacterium]|nr:N-6 DNA methylase [Actinomycetota bacterium]